MKTYKTRRDIVSRRNLSGDIAGLVDQMSDLSKRRSAIVSLLKGSLGDGRAIIQESFRGGGKGPDTGRGILQGIDQTAMILKGGFTQGAGGLSA